MKEMSLVPEAHEGMITNVNAARALPHLRSNTTKERKQKVKCHSDRHMWGALSSQHPTRPWAESRAGSVHSPQHFSWGWCEKDPWAWLVSAVQVHAGGWSDGQRCTDEAGGKNSSSELLFLLLLMLWSLCLFWPGGMHRHAAESWGDLSVVRPSWKFGSCSWLVCWHSWWKQHLCRHW